ncbi:hypothetical protein D917_07692 [Trichinella nativa]|uniref:Uncharacterized protein n=1 Tax=Trichinella nativa TaxID=6335 RepID=A0A1Y3ENH7_9BILA|nr:hypothetical protein D917_07692 [Trichinella nativa]
MGLFIPAANQQTNKPLKLQHRQAVHNNNHDNNCWSN